VAREETLPEMPKVPKSPKLKSKALPLINADDNDREKRNSTQRIARFALMSADQEKLST
jgi:hypothetical protein